MKKLLIITPLILLGMLMFFGPADAAGNPIVSGTVTYDDYESGDIMIAILNGTPGDPGVDLIGSTLISEPGAYSIIMSVKMKGEVHMFAWNDVNGNSSPDEGEAAYTAPFNVNGDTTLNFSLAAGGDPDPDQDVDPEDYTVSGTITYDDYASGDILVYVIDGQLGDQGIKVMNYDTLTDGPGFYEIDITYEGDEDLNILAWNDVNGNSGPDDGEAVYYDELTLVASTTVQNFTLEVVGLDPQGEGGDYITIDGEVVFDDYESGDILVMLSEIDLLDESSSAGYTVSSDDDWMIGMEVLDEPGEFAFDIDADYEGEEIYLFVFNDVNGDEDPSAGEYYGSEKFTATDGGYYEITMEDQFDGDIDEEEEFSSNPIVVMPASDGGPNVRVLESDGTQLYTFFAYGEDTRGGFNLLVDDFDGDDEMEILTWTNEGFGPNVRLFELDGTLIDWFMAYDSGFRGGLNVVTGDFDADGLPEVAIAPQSGSSNLRVYDLVDGEFELLDWTMVYNLTFRGGMNITTGDFNGDGNYDIAVAPRGEGGPNVQVFDLSNGELEVLGWFFAYDTKFHGGVSLEAMSFLDSNDILVTAPYTNGGPNIRLYEYSSGSFELVDWFMAYGTGFRGMLSMMSADFNADGNDELALAPLTGGGPNVRIFTLDDDDNMELMDWFMAYDSGFRGGVNLAIADVNGDDVDNLVVAPASGAPNVRIYDYDDEEFNLVDWFWAFAETFKGGVNLMQ